jgi:hypothetical protein
VPSPRAYSSARLERFPDKEEVGGSSPPRPTKVLSRHHDTGGELRKFGVLLAVAGLAYFAYLRFVAEPSDKWVDATD